MIETKHAKSLGEPDALRTDYLIAETEGKK